MTAQSTLAGSVTSLPSIFTSQPQTRTRMRDFFSSHIRNANTRRAYREAVHQFSDFCAEHSIVDLAQVEPVHVAAFVETQLKTQSKPTVKLRLAALRMLFDWMVVGQVIPTNPAHAVRGPKHSQRKGRTPVLNVDEARTLLDAIDTTSLPGLRDRALIGLMVYLSRDALLSSAQTVPDTGWTTIAPYGFDNDASQVRVAGLRDASAPGSLAIGKNVEREKQKKTAPEETASCLTCP